MEFSIQEARAQLSQLLERVALGEEVIIAEGGTPVAKLVPLKKISKKRVIGSAKGEFTFRITSMRPTLKLRTSSITDPFYRNEPPPGYDPLFARYDVRLIW